MKCKIPSADTIFRSNRIVIKEDSIEDIVMKWLNEVVYNEIMKVEPKLSPTLNNKGELRATGCIRVKVPYEGYYLKDRVEFIKIVTDVMTGLGYFIEFVYSGGLDDCIIKWEVVL